MEATIQQDLSKIFQIITPKEKRKNHRLKNQTKKLKMVIGRFSEFLKKNDSQSKRGANG